MSAAFQYNLKRRVLLRPLTFTYKDRGDNNKTKTMTIAATEFIRRFLLHVLPYRFMKIRYYGFLANICKKKAGLPIRRLIGKSMSNFTSVEQRLICKEFQANVF